MTGDRHSVGSHRRRANKVRSGLLKAASVTRPRRLALWPDVVRPARGRAPSRPVHGTCRAVPGTDWHVPCTSLAMPNATRARHRATGVSQRAAASRSHEG